MKLLVTYLRYSRALSQTVNAMSIVSLSLCITLGVSSPADAREQTLNVTSAEISTTTANPGDTIFSLCRQRTVSFSTFGGSESWGYAAPGNIDYAIIGIHNGIAFVNASTGAIADIVPGPTSGCGQIRWRNMVTSGQYCYAVSLCTGTNQGIIVMDMSFLPDSVHLVGTFPTSIFNTFTATFAEVDSARGFLYVQGQAAAGRGIYIHDISDPANPTYVGGFASGTGHELFVENDTAYVAEGPNGLMSIWDLTNKSTPVMLAQWAIPAGGLAHNLWPTDDRRFAVSAEETAGKTVKIWDILDIQNVQLVGEFIAGSNIAHKPMFLGDTVYMSHFESGIRALHVSASGTPTEIAHYDTFGAETSNFNGAFGMFPFSPNGFVYASNRDGRLFIFRKTTTVLGDTLSADSVDANPNSSVKLDVFATNSMPVWQIQVPFTWAGPAELTLDSATVTGLRTDGFNPPSLTSIDPFGKKGVYEIATPVDGSVAPLAPGSGPIMSLYFTVGSGATNGLQLIPFSPVTGKSAWFNPDCGIDPVLAVVSSGIINISGCCDTAGDANNDGNVNISDVTFLIARIFASGPAPECNDQADGNGDTSVNIADVTFLIARIFAGGPAPVCGTTGS